MVKTEHLLEKHRWLGRGLRLAFFLLVPVAIAWVWGAYLNNDAYPTFRYARNLALRHTLAYPASPWPFQALQSPLYVLALLPAAWAGLPLPQVGLVLSALGWGAAAVALYNAGRALRYPLGGMAAAVLMTFNPVVITSLGTELGWAAALAWWVWALSLKPDEPEVSNPPEKGVIQLTPALPTALLAVLLWTHFDLSSLALAGIWLIFKWVASRRFPARAGLALAAASLSWIGLEIWLLGINPLTSLANSFDPRMSGLRADLSGWLADSELYALFLPVMAAGLLALITQAPARRDTGDPLAPLPDRQAPHNPAAYFLATWGISLLVIGSPAGQGFLITMGLFLTDLGLAWVIQWIETHQLMRLSPRQLAVSLACVTCLPLGLAQMSSLARQYSFRPIARHQLEQQAGDWLRTHTPAAARVLGAESVGYLADRATLAWDGQDSRPAALAPLLASLIEDAPDYCVSLNSLAWERLERTGWFQANYTPVYTLESPYDSTSPFTIWAYQAGAFDQGEQRPQEAYLPYGIEWIASTCWPERIQAADDIYVTLFLRATQPLTTSLRTIIRLSSAQDGNGWAQQDGVMPHSLPLAWWQPGQVITERFVLTTTQEMPIGAYRLTLSVVAPDASHFLPMYTTNPATRPGGDQPEPLEQITLGYIAIPWPAEAMEAQMAAAPAQAINARLGDSIKLASYAAGERLTPGGDLEVTLYWEALQPPPDDYVVFVHLLDANGQLVTNHDGPPAEGRYPTQAWRPGEIVPDTHHLTLPPDLPAGDYRLQAGMYAWPSLERLPAWDSQGVEQPERNIVLGPIKSH